MSISVPSTAPTAVTISFGNSTTYPGGTEFPFQLLTRELGGASNSVDNSASYTPNTMIGAWLIEALGPWMTLHLAWFCDAIGAPFEEVARLVYEQGVDGDTNYVPGYGSLFDVTRCSLANLPYLGQYVGVPIPQGISLGQAQALVMAEPSHKRGTDAAIIDAAVMNLTGTQSCQMISRQRPDGIPDAYWFMLFVRPEEVTSVAALTAAVNAVKPGGTMWALIQTDGWTISQLEAGYSTIDDVENSFWSVTGVEQDQTTTEPWGH